MNIWQNNAATFTSRQPDAVDQHRRAGVRQALDLIVKGKPGKALYSLVRSVERQARIAGAGHVDIHPGCPCGGRCPNGHAVTT